MPFFAVARVVVYVIEMEQRFKLLEEMRMDDDGMGQMHPTYANPWPQLWREYVDSREFRDPRLWAAQYQQRPVAPSRTHDADQVGIEIDPKGWPRL